MNWKTCLSKDLKNIAEQLIDLSTDMDEKHLDTALNPYEGKSCKYKFKFSLENILLKRSVVTRGKRTSG